MSTGQHLSSLFPYTTLFRSEIGFLGHGERLRTGASDQLVRGLELLVLVGVGLDDTGRLRETVGEDAAGLDLIAGAKDRKSTRLNSSHVEISYAVCSLKKKRT